MVGHQRCITDIIVFSVFLMLQNNKGGLPDNKTISSLLAKNDSLRKVIKKTMPFVQMIRESLVENGASALDAEYPFDQAKVLEEVV